MDRVDRTSWARKPLLGLLHRLSFRRGTFRLSSGRESDFFIDCKATVLTAQGQGLVGRVLFEVVTTKYCEAQAVAGVVLGGCPLATATAYTSYQAGRSLDALFVRPAPKDHGTGRLIEGTMPPGISVVLLEDVITTGASSLRAVEALRGAGANVLGIVALVDRQEGGAEAIWDAGVRVESVFTRLDFIPAEAT